ncbi:MAG: imidazole glycerol phosphate synthase subunit HisH [Planctomycetes bacterium]|nr:imidazole glycerol phosphate synthase subunit HisH [Planctomycetota bacterium]
MIAIIDYGMGNLRSVGKAVEKVGGSVEVTSAPETIAAADKLILPGVGAFGDGVENLRKSRLAEPILESISTGRPFLGICLGFQMLQDSSEESPGSGLGLIPGAARRFPAVSASGEKLKVPHMGWNQVRHGKAGGPVSDPVRDDAYFYFVHSYYVKPEDETTVALWCEYGGIDFAAMVVMDNVHATQFHPEKSQSEGLALLQRFVEI